MSAERVMTTHRAGNYDVDAHIAVAAAAAATTTAFLDLRSGSSVSSLPSRCLIDAADK